MKANNNGSYPTSFWFFVTFGAGHVLKLVSLLPSKVMLALLNISDPKGQFIYILEDAFAVVTYGPCLYGHASTCI